MPLLKNRLPSKREVLLIFALSFVLIYSWSTIMFFNYLPGWLLYLDGWTIAGIFAYSQVFALFESLLVLFGLLTIAAVLPRRLFRERFVPQGVVIVTLAAVGAVSLHVTKEVPLWPSKTLLFGLLVYLFGVVISTRMIEKNRRVKDGIEKLADRIVVLLYFYLPLVLLSMLIIVFRNVF